MYVASPADIDIAVAAARKVANAREKTVMQTRLSREKVLYISWQPCFTENRLCSVCHEGSSSKSMLIINRDCLTCSQWRTGLDPWNTRPWPRILPFWACG
jgi:hypothetical protein